jgi:hypothetical protein
MFHHLEERAFQMLTTVFRTLTRPFEIRIPFIQKSLTVNSYFLENEFDIYNLPFYWNAGLIMGVSIFTVNIDVDIDGAPAKSHV